ncbi:MAG: YdbL family protein [Burkholderiales bacterium]|nr:YdbL family protein [Opitutaceae bacterium]
MKFLDSRSMILAAFCVSAVVAHADALGAAKGAMRERVPAIDALKAAGAVGEANTGQLVVRTAGADAEQVVAAENADRAVIFAELAKKSGGTAADAGKEFARQLAKASKPGVWVQREDGGWYKK